MNESSVVARGACHNQCKCEPFHLTSGSRRIFKLADETMSAHERAMSALERERALARQRGTKVDPWVERLAISADRRADLARAAKSREQQRLGLSPYNSVSDDELSRRHERWRRELVIVEDPDVGKPPKERPGFPGHSLVR